MSGRIVLITGGARSGKSTFAERYAASQGKAISYIATAQVLDDEMRNRVALHRQRRPAAWQTYEAPFAANEAVLQAGKHADVILFDCLTLYISNLLLAAEGLPTAAARCEQVLSQIDQLADSASSCGAMVIIVTNEVGMGIVPDNALAREYRDIAGWANQKIASRADEVYLVISGLAVEIKQLSTNVSKEV
ncbi:MAG: bifunctional adenosylcobinamide kinase/adenosylcobinamide-phosphate guanylyltransferase [Veillonellales bacterium]